ncbi:MAG TPA: DUF885 domain-containing protein, partial [Anaerolineaceae bacterium]|nr:DUF885 domain-containing protein [Anaerolineaceae bacterium]
LKAIPLAQLSPEEQISYQVLVRILENTIAGLELHSYRFSVSQQGGFYAEFVDLAEYAPFNTLQDYHNFLTRLAGFRAYAGDFIHLLRGALGQGDIQPRVAMAGVPGALKSQLVQDAENTPFYRPFEKIPPALAEHAGALREQARQTIRDSVLPGYRDLLRFIEDEYLPAARESIAACDLPDGAAYYQAQIRHHTTLNLSPEQIHAIGEQEVQRIRSEMQAVLDRIAFKGSIRDYIYFLRTDPQFYVTSPQALLQAAALIAKRMDGELPRLFGKLPRLPYGIRATPDYIAPYSTTAYYFPGTGDGTRAGYYYVNTYGLKSRPLYELEALTLHEAVPGHHLQIAMQQELSDLPALRRFYFFNAYIEGWALYSERLGLESGFYTDPASNFGRLTYEMWRACRLVVDTGMHALGWTRQQAIDFMVENSALTVLNITNEVDRYIAWPAQALAYKLGEIQIRQLRQNAEQVLGARFNLRSFHDTLLGSGAVPLDVLTQMIHTWIEKENAK